MKPVKMLGLAAVAATALMAFGGVSSASAASLCSTNTTPCSPVLPTGTNFTSSLTPGGGSLVITAGFGKFECSGSEINGTTTGASAVNLTKLAFSGCNGTVETLKDGALEVTGQITGTMNGPLRASGFEVRTVFAGVECHYGGIVSENLTVIGGAPAMIEAREAPLPKLEGGPFCGSPAHLTASYEITSPTALYIG